jgi:nucleotide-binding universal stress UspA family protein
VSGYQEVEIYQRVLVSLEREGVTEAHLQHASALATQISAEVIPLRVITVVPSEDYFMKRIQVEEGSKGARRKAEAEEYVARLGERLRDQGIVVKPAVIVDEETLDLLGEHLADEMQHARWLKAQIAVLSK